MSNDYLAQQLVDKEFTLTEEELKLLSIVGSTEPSTFFEFCNGLRNIDLIPEKGDKVGWSQLFRCVNDLERREYVTVKRLKGRIESIQLTQKGADSVREFADKTRTLFNNLFEKEDDEFDPSLDDDVIF